LAWGQAVDPAEIVGQSIRNYQRDRQTRVNWAYTQTDVTKSGDTSQVDVSEVIPLDGTPYERLIQKNGHPLPPSEEKKETRKYERALRQREVETPSEREARISKYENEQEFVRDIPDAYRFELLGEEVVDGRPVWVIGMTPRQGFAPSTPRGSILGHIEGKLWIDKEDVQWAKAEAHVIDTIGIGWVLARIEPGTRFAVEQKRVEDGLWMPRRITIAGAARVMIVHSKTIVEELTYSGYRNSGGVSAVKRAGTNPNAVGGSQSFR
jgi:hypothetical protein